MKVSAIIRFCGGQTAVARKLGFSQQRVFGWVKRDKIPDRCVPLMITHFEHIVSREVFEA